MAIDSTLLVATDAELEDYLRLFRALAAEAMARGGHVFTHVPE